MARAIHNSKRIKAVNMFGTNAGSPVKHPGKKVKRTPKRKKKNG